MLFIKGPVYLHVATKYTRDTACRFLEDSTRYCLSPLKGDEYDRYDKWKWPPITVNFKDISWNLTHFFMLKQGQHGP